MQITAEAPAAAPNGHHVHKSFGDTVYKGVLRNIPMPDGWTAEAAIEQMYSRGYVVFPGVLSRSEVSHFRALMDAKGGSDESVWEVKDWCYNRHQVTDFENDPRFLSLIDRPGVIETVEAIHDPGTHVTGGSLWTTGAGRAMGIHIDYLPVSLPTSVHHDPTTRVPIFTSTAHFYLNDMVAELGPTLIIPGSHRAGRPPHDETSYEGVEPQALMLNAGDVCLFRGDIWHGASMNSSKVDKRYMIQIHYGNGLVGEGYPQMCYPSLWNPEVLARATPRQRRLLGGKG